MVGFSSISDLSGRRSLDDERKINRWKEIVSRFKGKLIKRIKDFNGRFDDYSTSPKIRQILLHWGYELVESNLLWFFSLTIFGYIKRSYYWFNRQELLHKAKYKYHNGGGKKEAAEYYIDNKEILK